MPSDSGRIRSSTGYKGEKYLETEHGIEHMTHTARTLSDARQDGGAPRAGLYI